MRVVARRHAAGISSFEPRHSRGETALHRWLGVLGILGSTLLLAGTPPSFAGGTFYVDGANPACSEAGPGSESQPYCTISAAVAAQAGPGTTILVHSGIYREQVTLPASGAPGDPLVLQGVGAPIVDGADDFSSAGQWAPFSGDVWLAGGVTWPPEQVFTDGVRLTPSTDDPALLAVGTFRYVAGQGLYVNVGGVSPATHQAAVGRRSFGFHLMGTSWVTLDGFQVTRAERKGIQVSDASDNATVRNCRVTFCRSNGIAVFGCHGVLVERNIVSDNTHHGISLRLGTTESTVQDNESHRNVGANSAGFTDFATGIYASGAPSNLFQRNRVHGNEDTGLEIQNGSNDCISIQNVSYQNGDHGFEHLLATGTIDIGNVAWGNQTDGFSVEGSSTGTGIFDCIGVDNGGRDLYIDPGSTAGFASDYNIFWNSTGQSPFKYDGVTYATIAEYQAASGLDGQSLQADPMFVQPATGDFHLRAGSPAIDNAITSLAHWPPTDADGNDRFDDPATTNGGVGPPISYGDRGAFEFDGSVTAVGDPLTATGVSLSGAFPNPGRGAVQFLLDLPRAARLRWSIHDLNGREVWQDAALLDAGRHALVCTGGRSTDVRWSAGVYFARFDVEGRSLARRFVVVR